MKLSRRAVMAGAGSAALAPKTFAQPRHQYALTPVQVASDLWMIEGSTDYFSTENGGAIVNCALLKTDVGMVVVDTGPSLRYGEALRKVANELQPLGVAAVIVTHHHPDHFFGNQLFSDVPIHALPETRDLAETHGDGFADNLYRLLGDWMRGTEPLPPTHAIETSHLVIGGRTFEMLPMSGHSEADLAILDQQTGTLVAGDLVFHNRAPTTPSADLTLWRQTLDILATVDAAAILPGHGPLDRTGASIEQTADYLNWLERILTDAADAGLDMVEIQQTPLPDAYAGLGAMPEEFHRSVSHLFPGIELQALPLSD